MIQHNQNNDASNQKGVIRCKKNHFQIYLTNVEWKGIKFLIYKDLNKHFQVYCSIINVESKVQQTDTYLD